MSVADQITQKLQVFAPGRLEVIDESSHHAGHSHEARRGESHFRIRIASAALAPLSRLARHRAIHEAIGPDLIARIHALAIEVEA